MQEVKKTLTTKLRSSDGASDICDMTTTLGTDFFLNGNETLNSSGRVFVTNLSGACRTKLTDDLLLGVAKSVRGAIQIFVAPQWIRQVVSIVTKRDYTRLSERRIQQPGYNKDTVCWGNPAADVPTPDAGGIIKRTSFFVSVTARAVETVTFQPLNAERSDLVSMPKKKCVPDNEEDANEKSSRICPHDDEEGKIAAYLGIVREHEYQLALQILNVLQSLSTLYQRRPSTEEGVVPAGENAGRRISLPEFSDDPNPSSSTRPRPMLQVNEELEVPVYQVLVSAEDNASTRICRIATFTNAITRACVHPSFSEMQDTTLLLEGLRLLVFSQQRGSENWWTELLEALLQLARVISNEDGKNMRRRDTKGSRKKEEACISADTRISLFLPEREAARNLARLALAKAKATVSRESVIVPTSSEESSASSPPLQVEHIQSSMLVHCMEGRSRSPATVMYYFMDEYKVLIREVAKRLLAEDTELVRQQTADSQLWTVSYGKFFAAMQKARPQMMPNMCFLMELSTAWRRWIQTSM